MLCLDSFATNCHAVNIGKYSFYFSFKMPVAFMQPGRLLYVIKNKWGKITGHHIEIIAAGKSIYQQLEPQEFDVEFESTYCKALMETAVELTKNKMNIQIEE